MKDDLAYKLDDIVTMRESIERALRMALRTNEDVIEKALRYILDHVEMTELSLRERLK